MAFGSNVAPKRRVILQSREPWHCSGCSKSNAYYWRTCPNCGNPRPH
ncbi:MAG: hypothetical protein IT304_09950 [Dehalococcoidia bacterium]|nr:hypothetical protein [Dehalococcoidia bacterium]